MRVLERRQQAIRHRGALRSELRVNAGDDHVEGREQGLLLIERSVLQDVYLDAAQDAERCQASIELGDRVELLPQALGVQAARDLEAR
jgi:hypothetical protein